jgi:protein transport protein SEC61 subunit beta
MTVSPSATTAGKSEGGVRTSPRAAAGGPALRQRKPAGGTSSRSSATAGRTVSAGNNNMWRFYTEDSPGLKVGPVPVLVMSLIFIASVFVLHIWGKYTRN